MCKNCRKAWEEYEEKKAPICRNCGHPIKYVELRSGFSNWRHIKKTQSLIGMVSISSIQCQHKGCKCAKAAPGGSQWEK